MAVLLASQSPEQALNLFRSLLDPSRDFARVESIDLGDWAVLHVYLPQTDINSAITPPYMEAFLELQKQVYQLAALAQTGLRMPVNSAKLIDETCKST